MEFTYFNLSSPPLVITFSVTILFCLLTFLFSIRLSSRKPELLEVETTAVDSETKSSDCSFSCDHCNGVVLSGADSPEKAKQAEAYANGASGVVGKMGEDGPVVVAATAATERQTGVSMMEQLVPEITTHALSYLDYPSLCRLSMTNSLMRKAANDDNAWKALYHKDFTLEQDNVRPVNGWKAYYAATRAIVNINVEFFNIIRDRLLPAMSCFWLNADYVKCIHASGELFSGYNAVMQSWQIAFNWEQQQGNGVQIHDVRTRVLTDMAWVTMKTYVGVDTAPYNVTNVFELHNDRWYMVHHHCSVMLADGVDDQQIVHA